MIFNEWIKDESLFSEINQIKSFPFIEVYGTEKLDLLYKVKYGNQSIPKSVERLTVSDVAHIIVISYGDSWESQYDILMNEIQLGVGSSDTIEETVSEDILRTLDSDNINKVSAFNSDDLKTNDSSVDSVNEDSEKKLIRNREQTNKSFTAIQKQLELFNSSFIIDVVCKDVKNTLSLSIH